MLLAGTARTNLTPFWGVELTGWGYYIERRWRKVHDPLYATAVAFDDRRGKAILVTLDLMVIDEAFARKAREIVEAELGIPGECVLLTCSHSHNAPSAGGLRGVGECNPVYEDWAARQAATAAILAWQSREPVLLRANHIDLNGLTYNRTRPNGVIDNRVTAARIDRINGSPLAIIVNFGAHPTVCTELRPWDVSRDIPGEVCDIIEELFPGCTAMYVQGACGDTNFNRDFQCADRCREPAYRLATTAIEAIEKAPRMTDRTIAARHQRIQIPTRRWTREEIDADRREAERRLAESDVTGWRESIGRSMTNRPDDMVTRHGGDEWKAVQAMCRFHIEWTDQILADLDSRPEFLETEVQSLRIGDLYIVANSSEFFSPFALDVRARSNVRELMIACYSNGRIGYLPDEHDINAKSYAGLQSPKYCNQFPFTAQSGPAMVDAMVNCISEVASIAPSGAPIPDTQEFARLRSEITRSSNRQQPSA